MKTIELTRGKAALVDDWDFEFLAQFKWYALQTRHLFYAARNVDRPGGGKTTLLMHRTIVRADYPLEVDHRDGDGLNNQRSNLRVVSRRENMANKRSFCGTSRYKGVYWNKAERKWHVQIEGPKTYLGSFSDETQAAQAYDVAAKERFGDCARLNCPERG